MKTHKALLVSTLLCLLPIALGLTLYPQLPPQLPIHFDLAGQPDSYAATPIAVFGLPLLMAACNLFLHWTMGRSSNIQIAAPAILLAVITWTIPLLCNVLVPITLFKGMGRNIPIPLFVCLLLGILLIIIGNYLPKVKPNRYLGIKLPWTYDNPENWRRTHRFSGFVWVAAGILLILSGFFSLKWGLYFAVFSIIFLPALYSWQLTRKHI